MVRGSTGGVARENVIDIDSMHGNGVLLWTRVGNKAVSFTRGGKKDKETVDTYMHAQDLRALFQKAYPCKA